MITLLFSTSHLFFWRGKNLWLGFHTNVCILKLNLRYFWSINLGVIGNGHTDLTQGNYSNEQANTCEHQETDLQSYFKSLELMGPKPKDNSSKFPEFFCLASKIEGGRISLWQTRPQRLSLLSGFCSWNILELSSSLPPTTLTQKFWLHICQRGFTMVTFRPAQRTQSKQIALFKCHYGE